MAKDMSSVDLVFKTLLESEPWREDFHVIEMPWRPEKCDAIMRRAGIPGQSSGRLVFGMMTCDGNVRPHPNVAKALDYVRKRLEKEGNEVFFFFFGVKNFFLVALTDVLQVVEWNPPSQAEAVENLVCRTTHNQRNLIMLTRVQQSSKYLDPLRAHPSSRPSWRAVNLRFPQCVLSMTSKM